VHVEVERQITFCMPSEKEEQLKLENKLRDANPGAGVRVKTRIRAGYTKQKPDGSAAGNVANHNQTQVRDSRPATDEA